MDLRTQIFTAVDNNNLNTIDELFSSIPTQDFDFMNALFAIQRACDQQNLEAVRSLLPYATTFFFEGKGPRNPHTIRTMEFKPYDTFFELIDERVRPTNNVELFKIFVPLILHNINSYECADILIDCYEADQLELVDCVLPLLNDLSGFQRSYAPHIHEFFEQQKAKYQHDAISNEIEANHSSSAQRKM